MEQFNVDVFLWINQYAGKYSVLDLILVSTAELTPYVFMLVLLYLWFSPGVEKKVSSFNAGLSVLLGLLISNIISLFYYHSRPFVENLGTQLVDHAPDASFPSDHTTFIFAIAIMLLFNKTTRVLGAILCVVSLISGLSRVFVGVHFPLDIFGAILVALFSSVVIFYLRNKTLFLVNTLIKIMPFK